MSVVTFQPPTARPTGAHTMGAFDTTGGSTSKAIHLHDATWEAELLELLSDLEQRLSALTGRQNHDWPPVAVRHGLDLVETVARVAEAKFASHPKAASALASARAEATQTLQKCQTVVHEAGPQPGKLAGLFGGGKLSREHRDNCYWALRNLPAVLERYLLVLGSGFAGGPAASKWVETCGVFLVQVKRVLAALERPPG